jgi:hypothetical protein
VRYDANYYYWPDVWVQNRPGMFTGSGMPMRFADLDGSMIDVYQAATYITDESGMDIPAAIKALLDGALGPNGYYGAFTVNMHTDASDNPGAGAIVAEATSRGVPVVSARQMLDWIDGRNNSSFTNTSFQDGQLHFTVVQAAGARGLEAMIPASATTGRLQHVTHNGSDVATTTQTIKGIEYAMLPVQSGDYVATYAHDTTPPTISHVAAQGHADGSATITWSTDEPSSSRIDYGTSSGALNQTKSDAGLSTSHSIDLSGLGAGAGYFFRVTSQDAAGNSATSPAPADDPATFTMPAANLLDTTIADFGAGATGADTYVGATGQGSDGEVILNSVIAEEFDGAGLPADWSATTWTSGGAASVAGDALTVDGARANTNQLYAPGHSLEFVATFGADPFQHVGFGATFEDAPWAMFSTGGGNLSIGLYARTWDGTTTRNTPIAGVDPTQPHRYRIVWTSTSVDYYLDGTKVDSAPIAITTQMRPIASDYNAGGAAVSVYWLRMSPYSTTGTFTSRVLDAGASGVSWLKLDADLDLPAGTGVAFQTRSGDTAAPDGTWSQWQPVGADGAIASPAARYIQYQATLSTPDASQTPVLRSVTIGLS